MPFRARRYLAAPCARWVLIGCAICGAHGGCAASARERLRSPQAATRARAAVELAEAGDREAVHTLVNLLEDRDAGVRLYAIAALERLCGTTYDYRHYAPESERDAAVLRWREALRSGAVELRPRAARSASRASSKNAAGAPDVGARASGAN